MRIIKFVLIPLLLGAVLIGCGEPIPIKEMTSAKKQITLAYTVKAQKYASDELEKSQNSLLKCHDYIKEEDLDKAKEAAVQSYDLAVQAYEKALPLLAKDVIEIAEKSFDEAGEVYAERLAADDYKAAESSIKKANELFQNKKYMDSYKEALQADEKANSARNTAIGNKYLLKDSIAEVKYTLEAAKKYNAEKNSLEKFQLASQNLQEAEKSYEDLKLKKGFSAIEVAKLNADEAYLESVEKTAKEDIEKADAVLNNAEKSEGAEVAKEELNAAKESSQNAKKMYSDSRFKESIEYSKESVRLAMIVIETKKPVEVAEVSSDKGEQTSQESVKSESDEKDYLIYKVVYRERLKDCLWRISGKFYKNPRLWKNIYKANKDKIKDPDLIYPGWLLKIPKLTK